MSSSSRRRDAEIAMEVFAEIHTADFCNAAQYVSHRNVAFSLPVVVTQRSLPVGPGPRVLGSAKIGSTSTIGRTLTSQKSGARYPISANSLGSRSHQLTVQGSDYPSAT